MSYAAARSILKDLGKKASVKKRIYPHIFRHSRATYLANHLTEAQMEQLFGWAQNSSMVATYVHLSGRYVDGALLRLQGVESKEIKHKTKLKIIVCSRCGEKNSPTSKFCCRCGLPLYVKVAVKLICTQFVHSRHNKITKDLNSLRCYILLDAIYKNQATPCELV